MMSASVDGLSVLTLPVGAGAAPVCKPCTLRPASTLRSVTGSSAGPSGPSAKRSTTPNGAAANLARGVFEILGQLQREAGLLGQGRVELHAVDHGIRIAAVLAAIHPRLERLVSRLEPDGHGQLARNRGVERQ